MVFIFNFGFSQRGFFPARARATGARGGRAYAKVFDGAKLTKHAYANGKKAAFDNEWFVTGASDKYWKLNPKYKKDARPSS